MLFRVGDYGRADAIVRARAVRRTARAHDRRLRRRLRAAPGVRVVVSPSQSRAADPAHPHACLAFRHSVRRPGTFRGRHGHLIRHRPLRASWWHDRQCVGGHAVAPGETLNRVWCLTFLACLALPAHAEWVRRVTDGIMGTRITVELWADDKDKGDHAIDAVLDEMRHIDES